MGTGVFPSIRPKGDVSFFANTTADGWSLVIRFHPSAPLGDRWTATPSPLGSARGPVGSGTGGLGDRMEGSEELMMLISWLIELFSGGIHVFRYKKFQQF